MSICNGIKEKLVAGKTGCIIKGNSSFGDSLEQANRRGGEGCAEIRVEGMKQREEGTNREKQTLFPPAFPFIFFLIPKLQFTFLVSNRL